MDDIVFTTMLSKHKLLPKDTDSQLTVLSTQAAKATHFVDHVIKPALVIGDTSNFDSLLSIMEDCDYAHLNELAYKIKSEVNKGNDIEAGMIC